MVLELWLNEKHIEESYVTKIYRSSKTNDPVYKKHR